MLPLLAAGEFLEAFWNGLWQGVFQLIAIGLVAFRVNVLYQRYRERSASRQEVIDEIDAFTTSLYKPRKIYQSIVDGELPLNCEETSRTNCRDEMVEDCIEEFVIAEGHFRSLQVKLVPLYGHHIDIFAHYLAIWRYLKEIRRRMLIGETLYFQPEENASADVFYQLIDQFRYHIMLEKFTKESPGLTVPRADLERQIQNRSATIYTGFFGSAEEAESKETSASQSE